MYLGQSSDEQVGSKQTLIKAALRRNPEGATYKYYRNRMRIWAIRLNHFSNEKARGDAPMLRTLK